MDDMLDCPLCFERYNSESRRPKILPCGHTFCLPCLCANDNKCCSSCRAPFKGSPQNFPDNYTLLSASDSVLLPKKKKFWCLDCKMEANPECEDKHTICNLRKILSEQANEISVDAKQQLEEEDSILEKLVEKILPIHRSFHQNLSSCVQLELKSHSGTKQEIGKVLQNIPVVASNPQEETVQAIKSEFSKSQDRVPILREKLRILELIENCDITVKPTESDETWNIAIKAAEGMGEEQKGIIYLLYLLIGREKYNLPEILPHSVSGDISCPMPLLSTPNGRCTVHISLDGQQRGEITISLEEEIKPEKKEVLQKGLNGLKLFPRNGVLSGCLRTDAFFKNNKIPLVKGSVCVARSPLHPLHIFVDNPDVNKPKAGLYVWGRVVENLALLDTVFKDSMKLKSLAVLSNVKWM